MRVSASGIANGYRFAAIPVSFKKVVLFRFVLAKCSRSNSLSSTSRTPGNVPLIFKSCCLHHPTASYWLAVAPPLPLQFFRISATKRATHGTWVAFFVAGKGQEYGFLKPAKIQGQNQHNADYHENQVCFHCPGLHVAQQLATTVHGPPKYAHDGVDNAVFHELVQAR